MEGLTTFLTNWNRIKAEEGKSKWVGFHLPPKFQSKKTWCCMSINIILLINYTPYSTSINSHYISLSSCDFIIQKRKRKRKRKWVISLSLINFLFASSYSSSILSVQQYFALTTKVLLYSNLSSSFPFKTIPHPVVKDINNLVQRWCLGKRTLIAAPGME